MGQQSGPEPGDQGSLLTDILVTDQLKLRPQRPADVQAENKALHSLARLLAGTPQDLLDSLVRIACDLCEAGSTGVSLLTTLPDGDQIFKWVALAGVWESYIGGSTPGDFSPCGTCLKLGAPQLYASPARYFTYLDVADPPLLEGLVIPLNTVNGPIGTIWIADHFGQRKFDAEDVRIMTTLAGFTCHGLHAVELADAERRARDEAESAVRIRDQFLIAVAHDLRGPLTTIKGTAQLMQRQMTRKSATNPERLIAEVENIDNTATRMALQIDELLDIARLQSGQPLDLRRKPTDLVALMWRIVTEQPPSTLHHIQVDSTVNELVGSFDADRLGRALNNLLANARKYSPDGGDIKVTLSSLTEANVEWALITVCDEGMGIPEEDLPHVFERFRRGSNVPETMTGNGIGLATTRLIIEQHDGEITATSTEGEGSTFTIRLPLVDATAKPNIPMTS
ncbi:MAG TPA: GAF domain-containing sensor histidine kinase [Nitrolancea sp.]|jgi:signal transduction histidine kinase|nr:GAF domain-containing sensor histidine kinase [Nitrolancea sp.]